MTFAEIDLQEGIVSDKGPFEGSTVMLALGRDVYQMLGYNQTETIDLRFFRIWNNTSTFAKFEGDKFYVYNNVVGWDLCSKHSRKMISAKMEKLCRENEGESVKFEGYGYRNSNEKGSLKKKQIAGSLPEKFQQQTYKEKYDAENQCAWLCIAALIDDIDPDAAHRMIMLMDDPTRIMEFDWMYLVSSKKEKFSDDLKATNIVNEKLKNGIGYTLASIKGHKLCQDGYKKFIVDENTKGQYVVGLKSRTNIRTHCVAIDCDKKLIYDCMENHIIHLNQGNLDHCVGDDQMGVEYIPHCYKIIPIMKKTKKRKAHGMSNI